MLSQFHYEMGFVNLKLLRQLGGGQGSRAKRSNSWQSEKSVNGNQELYWGRKQIEMHIEANALKELQREEWDDVPGRLVGLGRIFRGVLILEYGLQYEACLQGD